MPLLIFDCDGVLVDSEILAEAALTELLGQWLSDIDVDEFIGPALGMTTANLISTVAAHSSQEMPEDAVAQIEALIESRLETDLQPMPGLRQVLAGLGDIPLAIVSNSTRRRVLVSIRAGGLGQWLDGKPIFTAEQVRKPKPDPGVYLLAATTLGYKPSQCLVLEDSVVGMTAAVAAGLTVIGFTGAAHNDPEAQAEKLRKAGAWRILDRMSGLPDLIAFFLANEREERPQ